MADGTRNGSEMIRGAAKNLMLSSLQRLDAFTRKELILTISCVGVLALVAIAWRARSLDMPRRKVCQENIRQLLMGFNSYYVMKGHLPWAARHDVTNEQDWIFWQSDRSVTQSALAEGNSNFLAALRCPADTMCSFREYPYSYSMNAHLEKRTAKEIPAQQPLILIYEEENPDDGACGADGPADVLTKRHVRESNAGFLDGHVEKIAESTGRSRKHARP